MRGGSGLRVAGLLFGGWGSRSIVFGLGFGMLCVCLGLHFLGFRGDVQAPGSKPNVKT